MVPAGLQAAQIVRLLQMEHAVTQVPGHSWKKDMAVGRHELNWRPWFPPICEKQLKLQITRTTLTLRFKCRKLLVNLKSRRRDLFCSVSDFFDVCWYLVGFKASMSNPSCTSKPTVSVRIFIEFIFCETRRSTKGSSSRSCELDDWDEGQEHSPQVLCSLIRPSREHSDSEGGFPKGLEAAHKQMRPKNANGRQKQRKGEKKWERSMTRSGSSKEPADLQKSRRKVIFNPRLENNFTFPQISLKNLLLSEPGRFIQINGLYLKISQHLGY